MGAMTDIIIALGISIFHLMLSFYLKIGPRYKKSFRSYSLIINGLFIIFIILSNLVYSSFSLGDQAVSFYFNTLFAFYLLLFLPLALALIWRFYTVTMNADIAPVLLKYLLIVGVFIILAGLVFFGIYPFTFIFYGFAP